MCDTNHALKKMRNVQMMFVAYDREKLDISALAHDAAPCDDTEFPGSKKPHLVLISQPNS